MAEHRSPKPRVGGSNPSWPAIFSYVEEKMFGKVGNFFSESKQELAKVNWPNQTELLGSTALVIVITFIMSVLIFGIDIVLAFLMRMVIR